MIRTTILATTTELSVGRFDHPPGEPHHDPDLEHGAGWGIAFVRAGRFDVSVRGDRLQLEPGSVLLSHPGLAFRCHHHERCPDDVCLAIEFDEAAVAGLEDAWTRSGRNARVHASPRLALAQHRLARAAAARDAFNLERWALAALDALVSEGAVTGRRGPYARSPRDLEAVLVTCRAIEADPAAQIRIADRARQVGMTAARLTHAFRRYLGASPHQFVLAQRLAFAARRLQGGASVSATSLDSGFDNLSHFCRTFQRALGARPSAWRRLPAGESRRKVQSLLRGAR